MEAKRNKNGEYTISGITDKQMDVLRYLLNCVQDYTKNPEKELEEWGFVDITTVGCISFDKEEIEAIQGMNLY